MRKLLILAALAACEQEPDLVCYYGPGYTECYYDDYYQLSEDELFEELGLVEEEMVWAEVPDPELEARRVALLDLIEGGGGD
jgi:hypothetical protein